jgi:Animal haem peroxidase
MPHSMRTCLLLRSSNSMHADLRTRCSSTTTGTSSRVCLVVAAVAARTKAKPKKLTCASLLSPHAYAQWNDDDIYNAARMFTISVAQHITLHEFGPLVLGLNSTQEGTPNHDPSTTPAVDVFVALALSYAHSAFGPIDRLLDADWLPLTSGDQTPVTSAAVCTHAYQEQLLATANGGLDAIIRGMVLADGAAVDAFMPRHTGSNACSVQPLLAIQVSCCLY